MKYTGTSMGGTVENTRKNKKHKTFMSKLDNQKRKGPNLV